MERDVFIYEKGPVYGARGLRRHSCCKRSEKALLLPVRARLYEKLVHVCMRDIFCASMFGLVCCGWLTWAVCCSGVQRVAVEFG